MSGLSFSLKTKKTPFHKQKELEEEKKRRDDAEAAKVYEDFVKEFGGDGDSGGGRRGERAAPKPAAFVRGGTVRPDQRAPTAPGPSPAGGRKPGGAYVPKFMPPGMAAAMEPAAAAPKEQEPVFRMPGGGGSAAKGKPRAIDALLANLKREQEEREARKEAGLPPPPEEMPPMRGSHDSGDPCSTNLFLGNLAPDVDEQVLMREFGRFGPIGSVKIMWPRDEEQRRRGRNTGFVSFMARDDAEKAMEALDGVALHDFPMTIGWGKAVPLPPQPCWPPPGGLAAAREGGAAVPPPRPAVPCGIFGGGRTGARREVVVGVGPDIDVQMPEDPRQRFVIDAVAFYVMRDGCEFEQAVMEREQGNPEFGFLFDTRAPEHAYYRWRLFSLASGDTLRSWRVDVFQMVEKSNRWLPPPMTAGLAKIAAAQQTAAQRGRGPGDASGDTPLSELQREKLVGLLRKLTVERADICAGMAFAMDNAESAGEVVEILGDALSLAETPIPLKLARLFLLSDILHNTASGVRGASRYRSRLEEALPDVFEGLAEGYRGAEGRMAQELLRRHVLRLLRIWRGWFIFGDDFLNGLQATFLRSGGGADPPANPALQAELEALPAEEVELRCRRAGLSRKGGRPAQTARLLALDAHLHGHSAAHTAAAPGEAPARAAAVPTSKWATVDEGGEAAAAAGAARSKWELHDDERQQQQQQQQEDKVQQPAAVAKASTARAAAAAQQPEQQLGVAEHAVQGSTPRHPSRWTSASAAAAAAAAESDSDEDLAATVAAAKRQAAAAAAAAAEPAAPRGGAAAEPQAAAAQAGGGGGGAGGDPALDEERRAQLRQVELVLVQFRERLEDKGLSRELVEQKVAAQRAKLLEDAEAALAARAAASRGTSVERERSSRDRERAPPSHHRSHRSRSRSRERGEHSRRRSRSRSRSKERSRNRSRDHSRDRDRRSSRRRSRSRSRDRERRR